MNFLSKHKTFIIILFSLVVVIAAIILIAKYKKKKAITNLAAVPVKTSSGAVTKPVSAFPLKIGSEGQEVYNLQKYLNYFQGVKYPKNSKINENGYFGSDTLRVLKLLWNVETVSQTQYNSAVNSWILNFK